MGKKNECMGCNKEIPEGYVMCRECELALMPEPKHKPRPEWK